MNKNDELKKFENFVEDDVEDNLLISNMNGSFNDAFIFIYNYFEMPSDNVCVKLCGLDHKTIASYYNKTVKEPHYKNVIAICCGFNVRLRVFKTIIYK